MGRIDGRVTLTRDGRSARIILDRPPLNILTGGMIDELSAICAQLAEAQDVAVVTIAAAGSRAFCAGVDVADHTPDRAGPMLTAFQAMAERFLALKQVLIASVQGPALGGGWELVLLCDFVVAADRAAFGVPEITLASFPPVAAALLPGLVGTARALDVVLTGRSIPAAEAQRLGLATRVVPAEELETATGELERSLLSRSGAALRLAKRAVVGLGREAVHRALQNATQIYCQDLLPTADAAEGVMAFLEKRAPSWTHA